MSDRQTVADATLKCVSVNSKEIRDDLLAADNCEAGTDDRRVCRLYLHGYEHEAAAAQFMARHGVRCPYQNARAPASPETSVAHHDETYYRISFVAHGD